MPKELQQNFEQKLNRYEEEKRMPLVSRMEERALTKGIQQGLQQGIQQGLQQGLQQSQEILRGTIVNILQMRFETVPNDSIAAINRIEDMTELQRLLMASVTINSLVDFGQLLPKNLDSNPNNNN